MNKVMDYNGKQATKKWRKKAAKKEWRKKL